tara:strand:- start:1238 stop:1819 length:582 start_codon:yes stop_codon:yes gene_type:complete
MVKKRTKFDIGPSTNGLALPDEKTLPYPLRVQAIYVQIGDYVQPASHPIYTLMDSAGAQHTYSFDLPGQVTRISVRPGQIFTRRQRIFEFCCDSLALDFAAEVPPSKVKPLMAPPIQPRVMTAQRPRPQPDAAQVKVAAPRPQRRKQALAASAVIALIGAVALLSLGGTSDKSEKVAEQPVDKTSNATIVVSD